ncbi:ELL-associated factor 2 isoform X1 [Candoia aspera]
MKHANKMPNNNKSSPPKEKLSPPSPMDDIERELKAEAEAIEQMSSSDSSSESKGSSSSSSSENSSSDSEEAAAAAKLPLPLSMPPLQPQLPVRTVSQQAFPDVDTGYHRSQESRGRLMNTLRNDLQLSDSESDSDD